MKKKNVVLIGMPGCGKSTIGVVLAKNMGYDFLDCDLVIQKQIGKRLSSIIEDEGLDGFLKIEDSVNASIDVSNTVIATGGSAVYGENAMKHFKETGEVIFLKLSYESISHRLGDLDKRGVVIKNGETLKELYDEREPLYNRYADIVVDCENKSIREIVCEISDMYCDTI